MNLFWKMTLAVVGSAAFGIPLASADNVGALRVKPAPTPVPASLPCRGVPGYGRVCEHLVPLFVSDFDLGVIKGISDNNKQVVKPGLTSSPRATTAPCDSGFEACQRPPVHLYLKDDEWGWIKALSDRNKSVAGATTPAKAAVKN